MEIPFISALSVARCDQVAALGRGHQGLAQGGQGVWPQVGVEGARVKIWRTECSLGSVKSKVTSSVL